MSRRGQGGDPSPLELAPLDLAPLGIAPFDPGIHVSPFRLFRWLHDAREGLCAAPVLLDVRPSEVRGAPGARTMRDARPFTDSTSPPADRDLVLIDDDGRKATDLARRLREEQKEAAPTQIWALYGGLELYDFALDPQVVGDERFLD